MYAIQFKGPRTKYRWRFIESKDSDDPSRLSRNSQRGTAGWVYEDVDVAVRFAERYRNEAEDTTEWRVVPVNELGEMTFAS